MIWSGFTALAQNQQLLYNFESLPQSLLLNPGAEPAFNFHVGVPLLSKIHLSGGSTGVTVYDIFKIDPATTLSDRIKSSLATMNSKDFGMLHEQVEILSAGWRGKDDIYYSAGVYQELDVFGYVPSELALMIWEDSLTTARHFDFSDIAFTADLVNVWHFGISKQQDRYTTFGIRGKLYSSAVNIRSTSNSGSYTMLEGSRPGTYIPMVHQADMQIRTSGVRRLANTNGVRKEVKDEILNGLFFGGGLGLGLDIGFTRRFNYNWKVSGSVLDLGFIYNFQDVETYKYWGDSRGAIVELEYNYPEDKPLDRVDNLVTDLEEIFDDDTFYDSYFALRPIKLNAALDYGWGEDLEPCNYLHRPHRKRFNHYLGFHLFSMIRPKRFIPAATVYYDGKLFKGLRGKFTYTVDSFSYTNIGAMVSAQMGWVNLYLGADNLLSLADLAKSHQASVQMGVQVIIN